MTFLIEQMPPEALDMQWADGNTALHLAAVLSNTEAVRKLVQKGADPTVRNKFGLVPADMVHDDPDTQAALAATDAQPAQTMPAPPAPASTPATVYDPLVKDIAAALASSPIFSRPSFGGADILAAVNSAASGSSPVTPRTRKVIQYS